MRFFLPLFSCVRMCRRGVYVCPPPPPSCFVLVLPPPVYSCSNIITIATRMHHHNHHHHHHQPFRFEGSLRMRLAEEGLGFLSSTVDTLIVIPNQNLFQLVDKQTSLLDSFRCACDRKIDD